MTRMSAQSRVLDAPIAWPRSCRIVIAIVAFALLALSIVPATAAAKPVLAADRPTIVLVHGAWAGPSGWDQG